MTSTIIHCYANAAVDMMTVEGSLDLQFIDNDSKVDSDEASLVFECDCSIINDGIEHIIINAQRMKQPPSSDSALMKRIREWN